MSPGHPPDEFLSQRYPTVEQTLVNNHLVLYKRKKFFLADLRHTLKALGFVLLCLIYLRDISIMRFALRGFLQYTISNPYPLPASGISISDESKRALGRFLLISVLLANVMCFLVHLVFGVYDHSPSSDGFLYGSLSVQFMGERLPRTRWELLALDLLVFGVQIVFHDLMCATEDSVVVDKAFDGEMGRDAEGDGYGGNVCLLRVFLWDDIKRVLLYNDRFTFLAPQAVPVGSAGTFV